MTLGFEPLAENVLVRLVPTDHPGADDTVEWAEVVAAGPKRRTEDGVPVGPELVPGDRVALRPHSAMPLRVQGQSLAVVGGSDVLGILAQEGEKPRPNVTPTASDAALPEALAQASPAALADESLETDVAPDLLDQAAPTGEDLH